jgi:hypothetical protein
MANKNIDLIKQIVVQLSAANVPFGQSWAGVPTYRLLTPKEVVDRAVAIAAALESDK